jgi:hypothetical protein
MGGKQSCYYKEPKPCSSHFASKQRSLAARIVQDFAMSSSTKFGYVVKNYVSTSTERGAGGE